jgi:putrescine transport system permease protein
MRAITAAAIRAFALEHIAVAFPLLWFLGLIVVPMLIIGAISVARPAIALPPVAWDSTFPFVAGDALFAVVTDDFYRLAIANSILNASLATLLTLLIGFPMAFYMTDLARHWRAIALLMVVLPFWTSFLLRIYAWMGLLSSHGPISTMLQLLGLSDAPVSMLNSRGAVLAGLVYCYLPFMILPLYARLAQRDRQLEAAASDLGAPPTRVFLDIIWPCAWPGVLAGAVLVFVPALGEYMIPALLGRGDQPMIGKLIADELFLARNWPQASALGLMLIGLIGLPLLLLAQQLRNERQFGA